MIYNKPRDISIALLPFSRKRKDKKIKEKVNKTVLVKTVSFFMLVYLGTMVAFIIPLRPTYSESEKRDLHKFPEFTLSTFADGSYFSDISLWFSDTFPFREKLTLANSYIKKLSGFDSIAIHGDVESGDEIPDSPLQVPVTEGTTFPAVTDNQAPETTIPESTEAISDTTATSSPDAPSTQSLGAILVAGNSAYEYYHFSSKLAPEFINAVSSIKPVSGNTANVYSLLIPTSIDITLADNLRKDVSSADQKKALDYFNSSIQNVTAVSGIYDAQRLHRNEYTYFRTDHHWTALGAYYAYEQFAYTKGIKPVAINEYATVSFDGFLGSFYASSNKSEALSKTPDTVVACLPKNNINCTVLEKDGAYHKRPVITDVSSYAQNLKYLTFISGDQPLVTIENYDIAEGQNCLVIKESYGNAFVPFLIPHYKNVYVIDPRHYNGTLSEFVASHQIDDIVFVANISTTRNSIYIDKLKNFIR